MRVEHPAFRRLPMQKWTLSAALAGALATGTLIGATLSLRSAQASPPAYKVVTASPQTAAQLEKLLNEHGSGGWRYVSDIDRQLFIFEQK
jgi:hypothetical protein